MIAELSNQIAARPSEFSSKITRLILTLGLAIGCWMPSFSQQNTEAVKFEISVLGMRIGDLHAKKYQEGDTLHYVAESKVKFWFFGSVDVAVYTHSKYVNGFLVKSFSSSDTNRGNFISKIYWDGKKYVVNAESYKFENKEPVTEQVKWSSTRTFFDELKGGEKFMSEVYGVTTTVSNSGPNVYKTTIVGNTNEYQYQTGSLQKVTLEHSIKNFQYKRLP